MSLLLIVYLMAFAAEAQAAVAFERIIGGPDRDRGVFVSPTRDGGYIAVGVTRSFGLGGEDVYLVKVDSVGEMLWSKTYGGAGEDNGWSVHETLDGYILAGFTESFGAGEFDFYLIKTDVNGELVWSNTYGGEGRDRAWALALTTDGGFLLVGETTSSGAGEEDCLLVKTDSLGAEQWSRTYGGERGDRCFAVAHTDDGGYVLAGQTYSEGAGDRDAYVIKIKANGETEWSRTFGGADSDVGHYVTRVSDGSFMMTGYTTSFATAGDDPYLVKIDARGHTQWTRVLPMEGVNHTISGEEAGDGGFFLVGFSHHEERRATAALLVKADSEGQLDWHRDILLTSNNESFGYTVRATGDGGCVFTGHTTVKGAGNLDLLLVKVNGEDR